MKNKLTREEKLTIDTYNSNAKEWEKEHSEEYWTAEFKILKKFLPKGKIIEIGCGAGRDAKKLISMNYDYVGTDVAKEFVKLSKRNLPNSKFSVESVYHLSFKQDEFDGFWASAVFLHIPKMKIDKGLQELKRVTTSNGIGFISLKEGRGQTVIDEEFSHNNKAPRFWAFYKKEEFDEVLNRNNFKILKFKRWVKSKRTTWLIYFVKVIK